MYAIIQSGGHQVKVAPGSVISVDRIPVPAGERVTLDAVLLVARDGGDIVAGSPFVNGASVVAVVESHTRGPKVRVFKKKRRKGMRRTRGHRHDLTRLRITDIQG